MGRTLDGADEGGTPRVRPYRDADCAACRALWAELAAQHRTIYGDPAIGGHDPGRGLDAYLADPGRAATWVAEVEGAVVGMTGLVVHGEEAEVEPAVVAEAYRGRGIGRALVARAIAEARERGVRFLSAQPVARNTEAVRFFVANGFDIVGHVDLFQDLRPEAGREWRPGITLHGQRLRY